MVSPICFIYVETLTAALKTRFLFDISSNFRLRYYEILIPLYALSLNLEENAADTSVLRINQ